MSELNVAALGRISGKLLSANLLRNGFDLTFRNGPVDQDLLYLDVNNGRVGVNSAPPTQAFDVVGSARVSQSTIVTGTKADLGNLIFYTNGTIGSTVGPIIIEPHGVDAYVRYGKVLTPEFEIKDNYIRSTQTNSDISLGASGTGKVDIQARTDIAGDLAVNGNIQATGNVRLDGQFIIGDSPLDTITIAPDFTQSIIPGLAGTYDFGTSIKRWRTLSLYDMNGADAVSTQNLFISDQVQFNGNTISTLQSNDNLIVASASGTVRIDNISIKKTSTTFASSLSFSGSNYLSLSAAQTIGTQAYTFECFFYTASNGLQTILGASATGGMSVWLLGNGINPVTIIQIDRSNIDAAQYTVSPITLNTWHHLAVTRDSLNNASVFLDGVKATGSVSNTANYTAASGLIGAVAGSAYFFTGYLTQIKLVVGSNYYNPTAASIAVPTTRLTTSANTKLLLIVATSGAFLTDLSGIQTVSNIGGVTYSATGPSAGGTQANTITNLTNDALTLSHTGTGYLTINDTNAFRIPFGTTAERTAYETGATRWNSEIGYMECFDGSVWQVATGGGIVITSTIMEELGHAYTLIFG
jgi:hypothetical protein